MDMMTMSMMIDNHGYEVGGDVNTQALHSFLTFSVYTRARVSVNIIFTDADALHFKKKREKKGRLRDMFFNSVLSLSLAQVCVNVRVLAQSTD